MADIRSKIADIYSLEQLSLKKSWVHDRHPLVKLASTFLFIILVVSFDRYELARLAPFIFYPVILMALSETPWPIVLKRFALTLPFCLFAGISNVIFERKTAFILMGLNISVGVVSLFSIVFRAFLCVTAVLLLIAVTPMSRITAQLRRLHLPDIFVTLFEMLYRYIAVLLGEASTMYTAYMLRSTEFKGLQMRHMGSFAGQLLIRSYDRAERVYNAMKCRGYDSFAARGKKKRLSAADYLYLAATCLPLIALRIIDVRAAYSIVF